MKRLLCLAGLFAGGGCGLIDSDVADGPWSVILDQVANGVAVRMAVLYLLAGAN